MFPTIQKILRSYEWYEIVLELAVIWLCVYMVVRFLKGTRGAGVIKGFVILLVVLTLAIQVLGQETDAFGRLKFIYDRFLGLVALLLIVVFQPELRKAMIRLGHARWLGGSRRQVTRVVDAVSEAAIFLSKSQFGALIAIERNTGLGGLVEGGVRMDAHVSARLLESIFWPNSPLHDLGVVIRGDRVVAACVQFPLAEEGSVLPEFGSRHRAAAGLTFESDCLVVVVSEETGGISLVESGIMKLDIRHEDLRDLIASRLKAVPDETSAAQGETAFAKPAANKDENPVSPDKTTGEDDQPNTLAKEA